MKIQLGIALALHALVLGGGERWARTRPVPAWTTGAGRAQEIQIGAPPVTMGETPELPAKPVVPSADQPRPLPESRRSPAPAGRSGAAAPGRPAPAARHAVAAPPPALDGWLHGEHILPDEVPTTAALPAEPGEGAGRARGTSLEGGGEGEGDGGRPAARRRRRGLGESWDAVAGPRADEPPPVAPEADETTLPRRTLEEVVLRSTARLVQCYRDGLRREPDLAGRIPVRLSVDATGSVLLASDGGSTVADPAVVRCVLAAFAGMTFPARTRGGAVQTTYLVAFPM